jgi:RNA polymerase sigma factor (sigma-70 family)
MANTGITATEIETIYRGRFRAFVLSMTAFLRDGETALDVVQEGFALALTSRSSFRSEGSVEGWVWRIVLNVARDRQRSIRSEHSPRPLETSLETSIEVSVADDELRASLLALPERQRLAVFLRYYADLSYGQIAEALGVRPGTIAASLNTAHAALRQDLEEVAT